MIYCKNLDAFETDATHLNGELELKDLTTTETKGRIILVQKSFSTPSGGKIRESETPFGYTGMYLEIMPMKTEAFTGTGTVTFLLYDGDPEGDTTDTTTCTHLVATYGPFAKADFDAAVKHGTLIVNSHVGVKTRGRIQLAAKATPATGSTSAFTKGKVYARFAPNNG